jgi:hypothetical protein
MKKIISLFKREYNGGRMVYDEVVEGAEWVIRGEGVATRKYDGTCCMIKDGVFYKRYDVKKGKAAPDNFVPAQEPDEVTGHYPGWIPVGEGPEDQWHRDGLSWQEPPPDGTYELIGPKINGNKERVAHHLLVRHGQNVLNNVPRTFEGLKNWLENKDMEGVVWHHPDGRMVKIKKRDFGYFW